METDGSTTSNAVKTEEVNETKKKEKERLKRKKRVRSASLAIAAVSTELCGIGLLFAFSQMSDVVLKIELKTLIITAIGASITFGLPMLINKALDKYYNEEAQNTDANTAAKKESRKDKAYAAVATVVGAISFVSASVAFVGLHNTNITMWFVASSLISIAMGIITRFAVPAIGDQLEKHSDEIRGFIQKASGVDIRTYGTTQNIRNTESDKENMDGRDNASATDTATIDPSTNVSHTSVESASSATIAK